MKTSLIENPTESPALRTLGSALTLLPLLMACAVVRPYPLLFALALLALWVPMELAQARVTGLALVVMQAAGLRFGLPWAIAAALLCATLLGATLLLRERARPLGVAVAFAQLLAAVVMTLYQCSGYFAVGADGAGVPALLRSYRELGFHANWRTVLFSTIMMVLLITWPRKFKRLSRVLPAGFVGVFVVTALNLLLNPDPARSAVGEYAQLAPWLPFFHRMPLSPLSMLLIYAAWEEIPWPALRGLKRPPK